MFHFPTFPPHALYIQARVTGLVIQPGFPIRKSSNHSSVASSSRLIAGSYVLHRLLVPRHPPCALKNLTTDTKMLASTMQFSSYGREPLPITGAYPPTPPGTTRRRERTVRPKKRPAEETNNARSLRTQQRAKPARHTHHVPPPPEDEEY